MSGAVLVTGANGFVGRRVAAALAARGFRVRAHGRASPAAPLPGVDHVAGDLRDTPSLPGLVDGVDAVCHLAAFIPPSQADSSFADCCYEVNALASLRLAEAALRLAATPRRFVLASSASIYAARPRLAAPEATPGEPAFAPMAPVTEDETPYPAARATYYLTSKLAAELYLDHLARARGLALTTLRLSAVYGPGMPEGSVVARFMARAAAGEPLVVQGGGVPATDFVWVEDVVDLIARALEAPVQGTFNAGSGEHTSLLGLARAVRAAYADRAVEIRVEPAAGEPPPSFAALDVGKARRAFGYAPRSLADGLAALRRAREAAP